MSTSSSSAPITEPDLEHRLATPDQHTIDALRALDGDVLILGAGGKMGPTLARMARRAIADRGRRVIAVSRFSDPQAAAMLEATGVDVIRADLSDPHAVRALPDAANVLWMAGQKFGTTGDPVGTWTQNVVASVHAAERYAGARMVCFSTGNVYGRTPVAHGGSQEDEALVPDGEYAASTIGRERAFESVARRTGSPLLLYRLFYACDLRYGVVTELARRVLAEEPIDLATGWVNVIWQGDANRLALRALGVAASPPVALNVTGPMVRVRELAECLGRHAGVTPVCVGTEQADALVANVHRLHTLLPYTPLPLDTLCAWAVAWVRQGGRLLSKPTKFEVRDGRF
ncbi:MAG: NAD-dependent epimerase/dehydratase family protein [Gemmatimonas sp.]|jgi:nucleoside-diphosphate-sugar epimerase|uniref:NAD-dependent epimerase/dehydratase family protein n=1 Tax=Gemmatimonas sp. TaxID=1962908 RepID=UPI00391EEBE7